MRFFFGGFAAKKETHLIVQGLSTVLAPVGMAGTFDGAWLSGDEIVLHIANHFSG